MRKKPKYMKGVGASSVNSTEKATPKGASSASSTAAEEGSVYFCPTFWNSRANVVPATARYSSTHQARAGSPPAGRPWVNSVPAQQHRAVEANWITVSRKMSRPWENLDTATMWQANRKPPHRVIPSPREKASPPSQDTKPIPATHSAAASTLNRSGLARSTAQ